MKKEEKRLGFREWQWKYGKNISEEEDNKVWRRYYFRVRVNKKPSIK